jgi:TolA-binding protein
MIKQIRHINNSQDEPANNNPLNRFEDDWSGSDTDELLFKSISAHMKAHFDIEDVNSDPGLSGAREKVSEMIADYMTSVKVNSENEKFIKNNIFSEEPIDDVSREIEIIKHEIKKNDLDLVSAEWVKEWHEKKQKSGSADPKADEISKFINDALNQGHAEDLIQAKKSDSKGKVRNLYIRYISLSAAALFGVFLLIRTLLPSSDTEKLFRMYYEPFEAVSPVTRNAVSNQNNIYSTAISNYKKGDYTAASAGLGELLTKEPSSLPVQFYMGLTELAKGNYDIAITQLSLVANDSGEYSKEAKWYLGLSYLKTGNRLKASECFRLLEKSEGFYHDRSEKLLRRLK